MTYIRGLNKEDSDDAKKEYEVTPEQVGKFIGVFLLGPLLLMVCWNGLMPYLFGLKALNYLDKLLSQKRFQKRYKLNEGDLIILNNNILAHGRSGFKLNSGNQRSLIRIWVR